MINKPKHCTMFRGNPWKLRAFELINFGLIPPSKWVALNDPCQPCLRKKEALGAGFLICQRTKNPTKSIGSFLGNKKHHSNLLVPTSCRFFWRQNSIKKSPVSSLPLGKGFDFCWGEYFPQKINKAFYSETVGPFWGAGQNALLLIGVINLLITRRGPPCSMTGFPTDQNKRGGIRNKKYP